MKVIMLSNQSRSMSIFWRILIERMRSRNLEVVCLVPPGDTASEQALEKLGAKIINFKLDRKGLNPLADLFTLAQLKQIFKREKPDLVFATTIKPVIYGGLAAQLQKIPRFFATITGLGYAFECDTPFKKLINLVSRKLYHKGLQKASGVFFQNHDDANLFKDKGILEAEAPVLFAAGTGVDTVRFANSPLPEGPLTFLLIGRLLEAKGILEYAEAARSLKKEFPLVRFQLLGPPETGPGSLSSAQIAECGDALEYLGETSDVRPYIKDAHVIVLPSWREGLPTVLMEAMSMGRPIVATDVPGCREVLEEGINGVFAKPKDSASLSAAMRKFVDNPDLAAKLGANGRSIAEKRFEASLVADQILNDMIGAGN